MPAPSAARLAAAGIAALLAGGCVPWPHFNDITPGVTGDIAPGAELRLVVRDGKETGCEGRQRDFRANAQGEFYGAPLETFVPIIIAAPAHSLVRWALCIKEEKAWVPIYEGTNYVAVNVSFRELAEFSCRREEKAWSCRLNRTYRPPTEEQIRILESRTADAR